jgi:adenylate kinase family enzyme
MLCCSFITVHSSVNDSSKSPMPPHIRHPFPSPPRNHQPNRISHTHHPTMTPTTEASNQTSESPPNKQAPKPIIIYVVGAPGAGKGTLCARLAKHYTNIHHLSVGDHLRSLLKLNAQHIFCGLPAGQLGKLLQLRSLLPPTTIVAIINEAVNDIRKAAAGDAGTPIILVDGFPRDPKSIPLARPASGDPVMVLFFDCPRDLAEARFLERRRSADDSVEVFRGRYDEFERLNKPILDFYVDKVVRVGTETDTEVTWENLKAEVGGMLCELGAIKRND